MALAPLTSVRKATDRAVRAAADRDAAIAAAYREGHTLREIAAAAGLTFQRVHQIVAAVKNK